MSSTSGPPAATAASIAAVTAEGSDPQAASACLFTDTKSGPRNTLTTPSRESSRVTNADVPGCSVGEKCSPRSPWVSGSTRTPGTKMRLFSFGDDRTSTCTNRRLRPATREGRQ